MRKKDLLLDKGGSVTLEASIVFPAILLILFSFVFFSMFIYEKLVALDTASYTAAQRAATWDNSYKDLETGALNGSPKNDGLYWRLFHDTDSSELAMGKSLEAYGLAAANLRAGVFQGQDSVLISYDNRLLQRLVSVAVKEEVKLPLFVGSSFGPDVSTQVTAVVAEPVEYIRVIDSLRHVGGNIGGYLDALNKRRDMGSKVYITRNQYEEKVYHTDPGCRYVKRISKNGNLLVWDEGEACGQGYRVCKICSSSVDK